MFVTSCHYRDDTFADIYRLTVAERTPRPYQARPPSSNPQSGYRGVTWHKPSKQWQVQLYIEGRAQYWGGFTDMEEALVRHDAVVLAYRGDRAVTHRIPGDRE